ncbi:LPXTG cell wall anchor domain-containing protein [Leucobacter insecticola]|uniref:LPXTG cell wall anchor domain-containing protein n=1 Tax=Leucobacter insecticola TaxID=2714934 RepID=A0A6G8FFZ6_9MICO|nr:LPXTG cell wall anchor domain-containing protein [Leucobacter insecticola]QIM15163.1 LPXTG cell wall anchor domain-containing protein [Leucobacter insecticola]
MTTVTEILRAAPLWRRRKHPLRRSGWKLAFTVVLTLGGVAAAGVPAAFAAANGLMVSTDGVNYEPGRSLSMFEEIERIVPGDVVHDSVWVRNDSAILARLRIDVTQPDTDSPELAAGLVLSAEIEGTAEGKPLPLYQSIENGVCTVLANGILLDPGESKRLDFQLQVSPGLDHRAGVVGTTHFAVRGLLEDVVVPDETVPGGKCLASGGGGNGGGGNGGGGNGGGNSHGGNSNRGVWPFVSLTRTGATSSLWLLGLAGISIIGGVGFGLRARRKQRSVASAPDITPGSIDAADARAERS